MYFWLHWVSIAELGLSLIAASGSSSLVVEHGLLIEVASLVPQHGLSGHVGSAVVARGLSCQAGRIFLEQADPPDLHGHRTLRRLHKEEILGVLLGPRTWKEVYLNSPP